MRPELNLSILAFLLLFAVGCPTTDDDDSAIDDDDVMDDDDSADDDDAADDDDVADDDDAADDDDSALGMQMSDLAGWYQTQSVTFDDGGPVTVTRDVTQIVFEDQPVDAFLRGWTVITANTDLAGQVDNAFGIVVEGFLVQRVANLSPGSVVDDNLHIDLGAGGVGVYGVDRVGEVVTFTALVDHPDHTTEGSPTEIVLERMEQPVSEIEGTFAYTSFTYTDTLTGVQTEIGTVCSAYEGNWANIDGGFDIRSDGDLVQSYTLRVFDNDACAGAPVGGVSFQGPGFFDADETGDVMTAWIRAVTTDAELQLVTFTGTYTPGADTLDVELDELGLFPEGGNPVPSAVSMVRVP